MPTPYTFNRLLLVSTTICLMLVSCAGGPAGGTMQRMTPEETALLAAPYHWDNVRIGGGGFVSGIVYSPDHEGLQYIRTDVGGAYRRSPETREWIPLTDWVSEEQTGYLGVEALALDPANPAMVYMLAGISYFNGGRTAILRSRDYGANFDIIEVTQQFTAHGNGMGRQNGERLAVDPFNPKRLWVGTRNKGLFRSDDEGSTWYQIESFPDATTANGNGISFVILDRFGPQGPDGALRLWAGISKSSDNLWRSDDGGETWTLLPGEPDESMADLRGIMPQRAVVAPDSSLYVTWANGAGPHPNQNLEFEMMDQGAVLRYLPEGQVIDVSPSYRPFGGISVDYSQPSRLVCSTINVYMNQWGTNGDRIYYSDDGGDTWRDVFQTFTHRDYNGITWLEGHSIHWAGSIAFNPFNPKQVTVVSGNGLWTCDNIEADETSWRFDVHGLEETVPLDAVSLPGGSLISVIGDYDGFVHDDPARYAPIHKPQIGTTTGLAVAAQNPQVLVRAGGDPGGRSFPLFYSNDGGKSWQTFASRPRTLRDIKGTVTLSADGTVVLWTPEGSDQVWRTDSFGKSWTLVKGLKSRYVAPEADTKNPEIFYAYYENTGEFFTSTDAGKSFFPSAKAGRGGSKRIRPVPGFEGQVWIARRRGGIAFTENAGETFNTLDTVENCEALGFGKAAPGADFPTIYIWGRVEGITGIFRSIDRGQSWIRINDDAHQYGGPGNGHFILGDTTVFGRVYMSTAGRGIVYGQPVSK